MTNPTAPVQNVAPPSPIMNMMEVPIIHYGVIIGLIVMAFVIVHHLAKAATD